MTKLLAFLFTTLPALFTAGFAFYGRKYTSAVAGLMATSLMLVIFITCINLILTSIIAMIGSVPSWIVNSIGMFIPSNFSAVLSAIISAYICRAAYDYFNQKVDLVVKAS